MALIDKDDLLKEWRESYQYSKDHDMPSEAFFFGACIDQVESIAEEVDPVHYAGGCYCRECAFMKKGCCTNPVVCVMPRREPTDFCSYGEKRGERK